MKLAQICGAVLLVLLSGATGVAGPGIRIPSADDPLTIDGVADEEIWKQAVVLPLGAVTFGAPFPAGGQMRAVVRGGYLCFSTWIPETGRLVARSTGKDPVWWKEDLVTWTVHFHGFAVSRIVSVNPLGAFRVESTRLPDSPAPEVLAAASIGSEGWSAEAAIPIASIGKIGFLSAERIRAPRPDAPELRWHWPALNDRLAYQLADGYPSVPAPSLVRKDWASAQSSPAAETADALAREISSIPHQVWTDEERKSLGVDRMWEKAVRSRVTEAALAERHAWEKVGTVADWEKFRAPRMAALKASLGSFPERTPLRATVTRRLDYSDGFILEDLIFESRPGLVVTANLYLPTKIEGRIPAVVVVHSHHAPKTQWELQDLGMTWARSGTAVLVMDHLGAGERLQSQAWPGENYYSRYALGMQLYLAGESLMKWMVWDLMRGIDLLLERPYVDPNRIVMLGAVAGGGDPAAVTAALDARVAAVVPFNFGESGPEEHYTEGPRPYNFETADPGWGSWESTRNLHQSIAGQFFPWFICASVAPRPFLFSFELSWPEGVEKEPAWARYKKVFGLYGKRDHLDQLDGHGPFTGPGEVTNVGVYHRKQMDLILNRWLNIPVPSQEYHSVRPEADLMCLTPQAAAERRPKPASEIACRLAEERLAKARASRVGSTSAAQLQNLRTVLQDKLGDVEPNPGAPARSCWSRTFSGFAVEAVALEPSPGISVPLLLIKPAAGSFRRTPFVLALAEGGKQRFLAERNGELAELLKHGIAVCLADVRGTGETAGSASATSLAATHLMLGDTALGSRLKEARTALRYLATRTDLDSKRMALWGDSFAGANPSGMLFDQSVNQQPGPQVIHQAQPLGSLLALLTAFYEDDVRAVAVRGGLVSYLSVLRDRFCYVPQDIIVPGILEIADIEDLVASLAPRAVLMEKLVNGRNQIVESGSLKSWMEMANAAYRNIPGQLVIREKPGTPALEDWLVQQLQGAPPARAGSRMFDRMLHSISEIRGGRGVQANIGHVVKIPGIQSPQKGGALDCDSGYGNIDLAAAGPAQGFVQGGRLCSFR